MRSAMRQVRAALLVALLAFFVLGGNTAPSSSSPAPEGGDSLRGALEALDRRQRALQHRVHPSGPAGRYRYPLLRPRDLHEDEEDEDDDENIEFLPLESGQPEDIGYGFQRGVAGSRQHETHVSPAQLERMLLEYLDEGTESGSDDQRWSSPFREREEEEEDSGDDEPPTSVFRERQRQEKRKRTAAPGDDRYLQLLTALWDKYQRELEQASDDESVEKRQDGYDGYGYDFYNSPMGWGEGHFGGYKRNAEDDPWFPAFEVVPRHRFNPSAAKRFPVRKRSSNSVVPPHQKKVGTKVEADLADIFEKRSNNSNSSLTTEAPTTTITNSPSHPAMHKKSVDWSQYFGVDRRRKKSSPPSEPEGPGPAEDENEEEKERHLMEQYYRTLALATTVKRKRNGDEQSEQNEQTPSLEGMDQKLKAMEDLIVDEAVKFTGAHQGSADPKEIQTVKEQVLSRLAAAYSLEKMRQALDEFRTSLGRNEDEPDQVEKRRSYDCKELNLLISKCTHMQPSIVESCTWHHACQQCASRKNAELCNAGFMRSAEQECVRRATTEMFTRYGSNVEAMCTRGARRLLTYVEHAGEGVQLSCQPCVRRFIEMYRR